MSDTTQAEDSAPSANNSQQPQENTNAQIPPESHETPQIDQSAPEANNGKGRGKKRKKMERQETLLPNQCNMYLVRKGRYCNLPPKPGSFYCPSHLVSVGGDKRVPCPIDPSHLVYEKKLDKHVKKCQRAKRQKVVPPYIEVDINAGSDGEEDDSKTENILTPIYESELFAKTDSSLLPPGDVPLLQPLSKRKIPTRSRLAQLTDEQLVEFANKVEAAYKACGGVDLQQPLPLPSMESATSKSYYIAKDHVQSDSIVKFMKHQNLLDDKNLFVEFGAGTGVLSLMLHENMKTSKHVLIDMKTFRLKKEQKLTTHYPDSVVRVVADIKDLKLSALPTTSAQTYGSIVSYSKHLCGAATDLTIRCLEGGMRDNLSVSSLIVALCCHHKCTWKSYVNKPFLKELGFSKSDFALLCSMSSWAVCNQETVKQRVQRHHARQSSSSDSASKPTGEETKEQSESVVDSNEDEEDDEKVDEGVAAAGSMYTKEQKERLGWMAKRLLDIGRLRRLEQDGFTTYLAYYVKNDVTPENVLLIAVKNEPEPSN